MWMAYSLRIECVAYILSALQGRLVVSIAFKQVLLILEVFQFYHLK